MKILPWACPQTEWVCKRTKEGGHRATSGGIKRTQALSELFTRRILRGEWFRQPKADGSVSYTSEMIAEVLLFLPRNSTESVQRLDLNMYACLLWFCISWFGKTIKENRQTSDSGRADGKALDRKAAAARTMMHLTARTQRRPDRFHSVLMS